MGGPSQTDLDAGGTVRRWVNTYLGPSVGWVRTPAQNFFADPTTGNGTTIQTAGTYQLDLCTNFVQVSVAGAVTILLPSAKTARAVTQPGLNVQVPVTIVDIGGNAAAHPITIKPISLAETIMGLTQIQITSNFGGFILEPSNLLAGWVNAQ
jgi:hypothetical protein